MSDTVANTVAATRARLEKTLDAIDEKLDVTKQTRELAGRVQRSYRANPVPWIIGATAAAVMVAGLVVWAVVSDD